MHHSCMLFLYEVLNTNQVWDHDPKHKMADWKYAFKSSKKHFKDISESEETERTNITEQVLLHFLKEKARQERALEN